MKIGIDPDIRGGIAAVRSDDSIALFDMPTMPEYSARGRKARVIDSRELSNLLKALIHTAKGKVGHINIEWVHATPQMGVVSAFKFGQTSGMIYGAALAIGLPIRRISPQKWKRAFGLIGKPKDASRILAINNYPSLAEDLSRKKDVGKADALWIALF